MSIELKKFLEPPRLRATICTTQLRAVFLSSLFSRVTIATVRSCMHSFFIQVVIYQVIVTHRFAMRVD